MKNKRLKKRQDWVAREHKVNNFRLPVTAVLE
jgi:hypothetical protein